MGPPGEFLERSACSERNPSSAVGSIAATGRAAAAAQIEAGEAAIGAGALAGVALVRRRKRAVQAARSRGAGRRLDLGCGPGSLWPRWQSLRPSRLVGVDLPREKRLEVALTYIYGVGRTRALETLKQTGVNPDVRVRDLTDDDLYAGIRAHWESADPVPSDPELVTAREAA